MTDDRDRIARSIATDIAQFLLDEGWIEDESEAQQLEASPEALELGRSIMTNIETHYGVTPPADDVADAGTGHGAYEYRSGN